MPQDTQRIKSKVLVTAVVLAAGASRRMGIPKMLLPWGRVTVIEKVVATLLASSVFEPVIVTGRCADQIATVLKDYPVRIAHNPLYESTEMLDSLKIGLKMVPTEADACLIVLGDQPQIEQYSINSLLAEYNRTRSLLIIPSYQHRRGHPWLVDKDFWPELLQLPASSNLRDFLDRHPVDIHYLDMNTPSILADLDTPEDYAREKPITK